MGQPPHMLVQLVGHLPLPAPVRLHLGHTGDHDPLLGCAVRYQQMKIRGLRSGAAGRAGHAHHVSHVPTRSGGQSPAALELRREPHTRTRGKQLCQLTLEARDHEGVDESDGRGCVLVRQMMCLELRRNLPFSFVRTVSEKSLQKRPALVRRDVANGLRERCPENLQRSRAATELHSCLERFRDGISHIASQCGPENVETDGPDKRRHSLLHRYTASTRELVHIPTVFLANRN
ncbi:MAG: hypothetical protein HZB38_10645 [Planctomycetes bacterium]|nr:hypothetical protein [Planctomycetota bacterium]